MSSHDVIELPAVPGPVRLAVLISGGGTTMQNLIEQIEAGGLPAEVVCVVASRAGCSGIDKARRAGIEPVVVERKGFESVDRFSEAVFDAVRRRESDLVVAAGFLSRVIVPADFEYRMMNIHPSLIPAFCGAGMYGDRVHEAVLARGVKLSGCTVHFADNEYDNGPIITQRSVPVLDDDTPATLATRVFEEECVAYPEAIRAFAAGELAISGRRVLRRDRGGRA